MPKKNCIIHKHSFAQVKFMCSLMLNEFLLQLKEILKYHIYKD